MSAVAFDLLAALARVPLFTGLGEDQLAAMAGATQRLDFSKGATILRVGDPPKGLYFVLSGHVKRAISSYDGIEKALDLVGAGGSFGEAELFAQRPYAAYAVAVDPTVLLFVAGEAVKRAMERDVRLPIRLVTALASRQFDSECDSAARHFRTGCQRLLDYLLLQAGSNLGQTGETTLMLPMSKQLIASRLGITPETLSRALRDLSDAGLIVVDGRYINLQNEPIAKRLGASLSGDAIVPPERRTRRRTDAPPPEPPRWIGVRLPDERRRGRVARSPVAQPAGGWTLEAAINKAGRQRMLSQRMAKAWLMRGHDVLPDRAQTILKDSIGLFERQLAELSALALGDGVRQAHAALDRAWGPYLAILDRDHDAEAAKALFEENERLLGAAQQLTEALSIAAGTGSARLINLAGRERMLSERMAKFYMFAQWRINVAVCRQELRKANDEFVSTLTQLATAPQNTASIRAELAKVSEHWIFLQSALADGKSGDRRRAAADVALTSEQVLDEMDAAVGLYERLAATHGAPAT